MCGQAYLTSARIAEATGPFPGYAAERGAVPRSDPHAPRMRSAASTARRVPPALFEAAQGHAGTTPTRLGKSRGFRNAQTTVIAPTGTIGFMMDCDTTGIEPDLALVKYKKLVGGGVIKIVNNTVPQALIKLGYTPEQVEQIVSHIDSTGTIEGAPQSEGRAPAGVRLQLPSAERHALHPLHGPRADDGRGAAVHLRRDLEDHQHAGRVHGGRHHGRLHRELAAGAEGGRDLSRQLEARAAAEFRHRQGREEGHRPPRRSRSIVEKIVYRPVRRKLPDERQSITHKFSIGGHEGYITVGMYEDGTPGEIFITMAKEGSTISGLMDSFATAVSYCLQYGVPLKFFVDKFSHVRFEPSGWTGNPQVPYAKSIMDYIFRWLGAKFLGPEYAVGEAGETPVLRPTEPESAAGAAVRAVRWRMRRCAPNAAAIMTRNGSCYKCGNCGGTSGCS